jgi:hypothetical protein
MRELNKFFRIYCTQNHKRWPELIPHIEKWINESVAESTGYSPIELMEGKCRPDLFDKLLKKDPDQLPQTEKAEEKALKAYARLKMKAERRNQ